MAVLDPNAPTPPAAAPPPSAVTGFVNPANTELTLENLLTTLVKHQVLTAEQRRDIEVKAAQQAARVLREKVGTGDRVKASGYEVAPAELIASFKLTGIDGQPVDEERLARLVSELAKLPYLRIDPLQLNADFVTQTISQPFARRFCVLPLVKVGTVLEAVVSDPYNRELIENLKRHTNLELRLKVASKADILKAINELYGFRKSVQAAARDLAVTPTSANDASVALGNLEQLVRMRTRADEIEANDKHIINAVEYLFHYAFDQKASDIHIEPKRDQTIIRFRIDGVLHEVNRIPQAVHAPFVARIKTMCRMDIAEKRRPQDGRIKTKRGEMEVEIRVSSLPVAFGEKLVMRIFDPEALVGDLTDLGFPPREFELFKDWIGRPHGMFLITGPTGSGKTTTLYTALNTLADQSSNITTVEDPIEMVIETFNQVAVQPKIELDFAGVLRTLLRQDPDVIMVGEIRDKETADMAIQAALTGHLLLSTLHTNDTASAVTRLIDLGAPPFLIGSTLIGVMAQRLVRKVCAKCGEDVSLTKQQQRALRLPDGEYTIREGKGCPTCRGTGHKGRTGVFEMLPMTPEVRALIGPQTDIYAVQKLARAQGMTTLREAAIQKLLSGQTSFAEVVSNTIDDERT